MLNSYDIHELISGVSEHFNLTEDVVEKDYYVTQIVHTLSEVENEYFRLIFSGGTCLAKAHKIIKRMSEDVDFKIQYKYFILKTRIFNKTFVIFFAYLDLSLHSIIGQKPLLI